MKYLLFLLFIQFWIPGLAQTTELKNTTLKKAFEQQSAGARKDYCTTEDVKIEIVFSGNVQRVIPKRAQELNDVIRKCGIKSKQDWTKGTTELSAFEDETRYWLQLEPAAADKILSKYRMGDKLILYGQVITEHSSTVTSFLIVKRFAQEAQNGY